MDFIILMIIAIIPPIGFLLYIHHLDSIEPEPHGLIIKAMLLGAAAVIPAAIIEAILGSLLATSAGSGMVPGLGELSAAAVNSFVVIAPVEEALKLGVVLLFIWKNANFNEENDGIVYVGASAIGFSLVENILYVAQYGFVTGIMRAVTSIPLHTFTGVLMGYFVGLAKCAPEGKSGTGKIVIGFIIAYLVHAVYDTLALSGTAAGLLIVPLVIVLIIFGLLYMKKGARLSTRRWNKTEPGPVPPGASAAEPQRGQGNVRDTGTGKFKVVISRVLFFICAGFWALLIIGIFVPVDGTSEKPFDIIAGGVIITIIPAAIGLVLELSYYRQKKNRAVAS
ncbi:MAG TPA: PrsW family intramembrane metalloprotease [Spirochaetota bacterium]|nr:PrsW family intramembrane metalloprotease [Spirochaetota bacterium]HOD15550.1 PrsW family intramembrane metalloprotease [Spirochaetota bacterium]HPG49231.1 PrsW family intramembrane metalloprotease [Spirochaetota bacterium]HPN14303.1 PrsW family intramembrane metalloprotease [Spirochaetota bacterium]HQL82543.1 PrsW family intramembrane metalloprotease [Spirochaetota bacterium]